MIYRDNSHHPMCNAVEHRWYMIVLFSLFDSLRSYHCTLPKWHSGDHISEGLEKYPICHQWPQQKQKGRLLPPGFMPHETLLGTMPHETEMEMPETPETRIVSLFPY